MEKNVKKFRLANYIFSMVIFAITLAICIYYVLKNDYSGAIRSLGAMALIPIIYILEFIFRYRVSNFVLVFCNIYIFFASFLGSALNFYGKISFYDDIMHSLFGYVGCIAGLYLLVKLMDYKSLSILSIMLVTMFVAMGSAALWEVLEYFCDHVFASTAQGKPINGIVPLQDTMQDIIDSFYGMIVFEIHFYIHRKTGKKLIIGNVIEDFYIN